MRTVILVVVQQFVGYGISLVLFGHGIPTSDRIRGNSYGWLLFSIPILVYIIVLAVFASQNLSRLSEGGSKFNRLAWVACLAFSLPGLCLAVGAVFDSFDENLKPNLAVLDLLCILIVPAVSLWSARRFVLNFAAKKIGS